MPNVASYLRVDADLTGDPMSLTPSWTDYTQHFQSCRISRGRAGVFDLYKVGTLTLVARNGRTGIDAPWLDPDVWYRWRQIRVVYTGGVTDVPLFTGYITTTEHTLNDPKNVNLVTVAAVDKLGVLREEFVNIVAFEDDENSGVWANNGLRVGNVKDFLENYTQNFAVSVDAYGVSSAPIFFPAVEDEDPNQPANKRKRVKRRTVKGNVWQMTQDALEVEYGTFHVAADGTFAMNGRYATLLALTDSTPVVLSDTPAAGDYQIRLGAAEVAAPGSDYFDTAVGMGVSKVQKVASNQPNGYPATSYQRTSLVCENDNWVQANCVLWATLFSQTAPWMRRAAVVMNRFDPTELVEGTVTLGRQVVEIHHTPAGAAQKEYLGLIEGVDHDIQADSSVWTCTLTMTNAARWQTAYGTFDDYGILGSTWTLGTSKVAP